MEDGNKYDAYNYGVPEEPDKKEEPIEESYEERLEEESFVPRYDYNYTPPEPEKKNGKGGKTLAIVAVAIAFGLIAALVFKGTTMLMDYLTQEDTSQNASAGDKIGTTEISSNKGSTVKSDVADVAEKVMPSVVSINTISIQEVQNFFFGGTTQYETPSSGSGIIISQSDTEVLIATNNHVVQGSKELTVTFIDGSSIDAQIKGTDSDMDLAIIAVSLSKMEEETKGKIKVATLGDSDALRVGEPAIAIGNALGYGQSVTVGIVSALKRTIENHKGELIQTDAAINPGNSGGALLNANGEVIGINTAKASEVSVEGMGYAIPISDAIEILNTLMNRETREKVPASQRGTIGISGLTVDAQTSQYYNMPEGVYVKEIVKGSGAEKANLPLNCIITEIDGYDVDSMEELQEQLQYYKAGETVPFTIEVQSNKGYVEKNIEITLGKAK